MKSTLECMLTDDTASDLARIFDLDRERKPLLKQIGKERHIINK